VLPFTKILVISFVFIAISLVVSCGTVRPTIELIASKNGVGSLEINMTNELKKAEFILDSYVEFKGRSAVQRIEIDAIPAGDHYLRINTGSWDTLMRIHVVPRTVNTVIINTP
jgi:hypothetical protein